MSEKRFKGCAEKTGQHYMLIINDEIGEEYCLTDDFFKSKDIIFEIVDLLNVMNDTLLKQADENHKLSNKLNEQQDTISRLEEENEQLKKVNNILYNENIQLRRILVNYKDLINDVKYLEEKGVFDGKNDKKNI